MVVIWAPLVVWSFVVRDSKLKVRFDDNEHDSRECNDDGREWWSQEASAKTTATASSDDIFNNTILKRSDAADDEEKAQETQVVEVWAVEMHRNLSDWCFNNLGLFLGFYISIILFCF